MWAIFNAEHEQLSQEFRSASAADWELRNNALYFSTDYVKEVH